MTRATEQGTVALRDRRAANVKPIRLSFANMFDKLTRFAMRSAPIPGPTSALAALRAVVGGAPGRRHSSSPTSATDLALARSSIGDAQVSFRADGAVVGIWVRGRPATRRQLEGHCARVLRERARHEPDIRAELGRLRELRREPRLLVAGLRGVAIRRSASTRSLRRARRRVSRRVPRAAAQGRDGPEPPSSPAAARAIPARVSGNRQGRAR